MSSRTGRGAAYLGEGRDHHGRRRLRRGREGGLLRVRTGPPGRRLHDRARRLRAAAAGRAVGQGDAGQLRADGRAGHGVRRRLGPRGQGSWERRCRNEVHRRVQRSGAGQAAAGRHPRDRHPAVGADGGLRRPDPFDHPARDRPADPRTDRDDPRPRLSGVRDPAGADRQGAGDRLPAGRDLLLVRRHAAGAGQRPGPVPDQEPGRRRPGGLLAARRAEAGPGESRTGRWCSSASASRPPRRPTR